MALCHFFCEFSIRDFNMPVETDFFMFKVFIQLQSCEKIRRKLKGQFRNIGRIFQLNFELQKRSFEN